MILKRLVNGMVETYYTVYIYILVGGLEHEFYFAIYWECHNPN